MGQKYADFHQWPQCGLRQRTTGVGVPLNTTLAQQSSTDANHFNQLSEELRLTSPTDQALTWIVGAYYYKLDAADYAVTARFANGGATSIATNRNAYTVAAWDQTSTSTALFGNVKYQLTEQAAIGSGLRYTHETKQITETALSVSNTAGNTGIVTYADQNAWYLPGGVGGTGSFTPLVLAAQNSWDNATFDVTPEYRFNKDLLGYVRLATGFRSVDSTSPSRSPAVARLTSTRSSLKPSPTLRAALNPHGWIIA